MEVLFRLIHSFRIVSILQQTAHSTKQLRESSKYGMNFNKWIAFITGVAFKCFQVTGFQVANGEVYIIAYPFISFLKRPFCYRISG
jgi:hypothetical protein